ncbi:MAG: glycoside hydrolase family 3 protein [Clostridia bacterium]|nr:glycoside hydrolase family 3 protein [Clostridia bacterium]
MKYENNYYKDYDLGNLPKDSIKELEELSLESAKEGIVMLENKNNVLPLKKGDCVSVFGRIQREYYKSGTGSGGLVNVKYVTNIVDELKKYDDIKINEELLSVYEEWKKENPFDKGQGWGGEPWCQKEMDVDIELVKKARAFGDKAIVVIGRTAGEDRDNSASEGSYLLSKGEEELLSKVSSVFDKVIVILNVGAIIDMKWVEKYNISSVLYVWQGGMCGGRACAEVLMGYSPCGKLADSIAYDISDYSSSANFGGEINNIYKEDIYVGYRYFETFAKEKAIYPFGYGLSYTTFDVNASAAVNGDKIVVTATVENKGEYDGKEVVQVYFGAPNGKLGKASRELIAYAKTKMLKKGESETLTLEFSINDMSCYDDSGATGHKNCYVLEAGQYIIYAGKCVRCCEPIFAYLQEQTEVVRKCTQALAPKIPFERMKNEGGNIAYEPAPTIEYDLIERVNNNLPAEIPFTGDKGIKLEDVRTGKNTIDEFIAQLTTDELCCLVRGEGMNSPKVTPGTGCAFGGVTEELNSYGVPIVCGTDGPSGIRMDSGLPATSMPNGTCLACTFNDELVSKLYSLEGVEMTAYEIDVILGPGINIHRSPLNGRNFEYFSEDPYLTGKMACAISKGLNKVGVYATIKHFMANSQEWKRHTGDSVISERALREIYARPFEIAVKEGEVKSIMTAYNSVNGYHAASNYDLTKTILRDDWGYDGFVMTDWWAHITNLDGTTSTSDFATMVKCQNDIYMVMENAKNNNDNLKASLESGYLTVGELQVCAKRICEFVMNTHAYERFKANGFKYDASSLDTANMSLEATLENVELDTVIPMHFKKAGRYVVELEFTTPQSELAQIKIPLKINKMDACTFVAKGTNGAQGVVKANTSIMQWEQKLVFSSENEVKINKVKFYI